jgi:DUF917 family protein
MIKPSQGLKKVCDMSLKIGIEDLEDLARGAAFLGTGGGGDPYIGRLAAREAFQAYGLPEIWAPMDVPDDALLCTVAGYGAPTVAIEKLICGDEVEHCLAIFEKHLGRKVDALIPAEIGGSNSLTPLMLAVRRGLPVVDADGMGRAFPELQMNSFCVHNIRATPLALVDEHLNSAIIDADSDVVAEQMTRALAIQMGLRVFISCFVMSGKQLKEAAIHNTLSIALGIGRTIAKGRREGDPVEALNAYLCSTPTYGYARTVFDGKIIDLRRETTKGFSMGHCVLGAMDGSNDQAEVMFQNEHLIVRINGVMQAVVPDLICIVDRETAEPIPVPGLKYGQRVKVIAIRAPEKMRSAAALKAFGPAAFGISEDYQMLDNKGHSAEL